MQPIFKELIKFWNDLGCSLPIEEGKYWLDNHFICAFDTGGASTSYSNTKYMMT